MVHLRQRKRPGTFRAGAYEYTRFVPPNTDHAPSNRKTNERPRTDPVGAGLSPPFARSAKTQPESGSRACARAGGQWPAPTFNLRHPFNLRHSPQVEFLTRRSPKSQRGRLWCPRLPRLRTKRASARAECGTRGKMGCHRRPQRRRVPAFVRTSEPYRPPEPREARPGRGSASASPRRAATWRGRPGRRARPRTGRPAEGAAARRRCGRCHRRSPDRPGSCPRDRR